MTKWLKISLIIGGLLVALIISSKFWGPLLKDTLKSSIESWSGKLETPVVEQSSLRGDASGPETKESKTSPGANQTTSSYQRMDMANLAKLHGFLIYYYDESNPPQLDKLKMWGANSITINVEDKDAVKEQNKLLTASDIAVDSNPEYGPPANFDLEKNVKKLVEQAHQQGLAVKLEIPVTEKWLKNAEEWQVEMISIGDEMDGKISEKITTEEVNKIMRVLLAQAKKYYSGWVGVGFTDLADRLSLKETSAAKQYNLQGFDFLTINPHPDPSMGSEKLLNYITVFSNVAKEMADNFQLKKVAIGALMVNAASEKTKGFTEASGISYTDEEEAQFYQELFKRTSGILAGYFLQFSGWETRPSTQVISSFYQSNQ